VRLHTVTACAGSLYRCQTVRYWILLGKVKKKNTPECPTAMKRSMYRKQEREEIKFPVNNPQKSRTGLTTADGGPLKPRTASWLRQMRPRDPKEPALDHCEY
jgi:hypothetical protein